MLRTRQKRRSGPLQGDNRPIRRPGGIFLALALPLLVLGATGSPAIDAEVLVEVRRLEARLSDVRGLVGRFSQTLESPALPGPRVESGTVYLLRPGRMRWEYDEPEGKLAIADGERTHLYLPEDRQVVIAPMPTAGSGSGIGFLLRDQIDIVREFHVAWGERSPDRAGRPLVLTPRSRDAAYDRLVLEIADDYLIDTLTVVDPLGSTVVYRFSRVRLVSTLAAGLFRFDPPPGIDVQEVAP